MRSERLDDQTQVRKAAPPHAASTRMKAPKNDTVRPHTVVDRLLASWLDRGDLDRASTSSPDAPYPYP